MAKSILAGGPAFDPAPRMADSPMPNGAAFANEEHLRLLEPALGVSRLNGALVDRIALELACDILDRRLLPGSELNSVELARRFGTSRTPIREALSILHRQGVIEMPPRRRPHLAKLTLARIVDIFEMRAVVLGFACMRLVTIAADDEIAAMAVECEEMARAVETEDKRRFFWATVKFYELLANSCGNVAAADYLNSQSLLTLQYRRLCMDLSGWLDVSVRLHFSLLAALRERNGSLAAEFVKAIVNKVSALLIEQEADLPFDRETKGGRLVEDAGAARVSHRRES